ncbi:MAG TPA: hypothetical protein VNX68_10705, partial [Nitrosopumilaceae archaeon]|nr:hypothetical protein [Nitrosopumilaceae archaeon]
QWLNSYNNSVRNGDDFPKDIAINGLGEVFIVGYTLASGTINYDCITYKIPSSGAGQAWTKTVAGTFGDQDQGNAINIDGSGNILITGFVNNGPPTGIDLLTVKYDAIGNQTWKKVYNGKSNGTDEGSAIVSDPGGDVYITGFSNYTGQNNNYNTVKYLSASGTINWITQYNGTGNGGDQAIGIFLDGNNNVIISGTSYGNGTNDDFETIKYCQLKAEAGIDTAVCLGNSYGLVALAPGAISYVWKDTLGNSLGSTANITVTPGTTMKYIVAITNNSGCTDFDTVKVSVYPLATPVITVSPSNSVCAGDTITLKSTHFPHYLWAPSGVTTQSTKVTTSGTYSLTVKDTTQNCQSNATVTVTVHPLPAVEAGRDTGACLSNTIKLCGSGASSYAWVGPKNTISDTSVACPVIAPSGNTKYILYGMDAFGCKNSDTVNVQIYSLPSIPTISVGAVLTANSATAVQWQWYNYNCNT